MERPRDVIAIQPDKSILAAFVATLISSIVYFISPLFGVEVREVVSLLGTMYLGIPMHVDPVAQQMLGFFIVVMVAIVVGMIYPRIWPMLPGGRSKLKGTLLGLGLWVLAIVVALPLFGAGFLGLSQGLAVPVLSLILHLVFGYVMATVYGHPIPGEEN